MTIAFLVHSAKPSGAELNLVARLRHADDLDVTVLLAEEGDLVRRVEGTSAVVQVLPAPSRAVTVRRGSGLGSRLGALAAWLAYGWRVGDALRDLKADVAVATSVKSLVYGWVASRRARVPLVWSVHDRIAADYFGAATAVVLRCVGRVLPQAYMVNSKSTLVTLRTGAKPVLVCPPGVALPEQRQSRGKGPIHVLMVGRLSHWKGQDLFCQAVSAQPELALRADILGGALFGEHAFEARLQEFAEGDARINLRGHVENVEDWLAEADILVHASRIPEPFGAVVIQGMAHGLAVIATTPGGPAEVITPEVDGLLVPCGSVAELTAALTRLIGDEQLRQRLGSSAAARARDFEARSLAVQAFNYLHAIGRGESPGYLSASRLIEAGT